MSIHYIRNCTFYVMFALQNLSLCTFTKMHIWKTESFKLYWSDQRRRSKFLDTEFNWYLSVSSQHISVLSSLLKPLNKQVLTLFYLKSWGENLRHKRIQKRYKNLSFLDRFCFLSLFINSFFFQNHIWTKSQEVGFSTIFVGNIFVNHVTVT